MSHLPKIAIAIFLAAICVFAKQSVETQVSQDVASTSYEIFTQLAEVYQAGGEAPQLVAKLNHALDLIAESSYGHSVDDEAAASKLEDDARTAMADVATQIPAAKEKAQRDRFMRIVIVIGSIPIVVGLCTFGFYVVLRIWRWYEKAKLYEMRIVDKKKAED